MRSKEVQLAVALQCHACLHRRLQQCRYLFRTMLLHCSPILCAVCASCGRLVPAVTAMAADGACARSLRMLYEPHEQRMMLE
jgi:hypothetical protein